MAVMCEEENRCLTAAVSGELDHHRAKEGRSTRPCPEN